MDLLELFAIDSIEEMGVQDVYDISIEDGPEFFQDEHNYIANNIVVHNSHAAGMVVSNTPLEALAPLRTAAQGVLATQFPNEDLELLGLIKFDILAISTLSVIKKATEMVKENWGVEIPLENLPLDDQDTLELYRTGNLGGVFQCENWGMQKTMTEIGVDRFEDVVAGLALYRPGPMDSIPEYCARKRGNKRVDYFHPTIEPFVKPYLEKTYGVLCVHEDTLVAMADGSHKPIKDVETMERVLSYSSSTIVEGKEVHGCAPTRKCRGYKLTLSNGRSVILTGDHKVFTWDGMKEVRDLDPNSDLIACPSILDREHDETNQFEWLGTDESVSYLIGFMLGDGSIGKGVSLCFGTEEKCDLFRSWLSANLPLIKAHKYFHARCWYLSISSDVLVEDWKETGCGNRKTKLGKMIDDLGLRVSCYYKRIPPSIFRMPDSALSACLAGLVDSDGCISYGKDGRAYINITTVSRGLQEDIRHLCDHLQIETRIAKNKVFLYRVDVFKGDVAGYLVLKSIRPDSKVEWRGKANFYKRSYLEEVRKREGLSERAFCKKYDINRRNYGKKRNELSLHAIGPNFACKHTYHNGHLYFYKIQSIEVTEELQFYGMSVADNHNFFANGILVSNCYQEQVMQICNSLAGFTITDGYQMIKAIGKKKEHLMKMFEKQFVEGCEANGVPVTVAQDYWDKFITPFASYGFNLAHSACYGYNSYTTAYLKANYPDEFICAFMDVTANSSQANRYEKLATFEKEFEKKMGVKFLKRDVNTCRVDYTIVKRKDKKKGIDKTEIRPTLLCKGLTLQAARHLEQKQPFKNLREFIDRTDGSIIDIRVFDALVKNGYFGTKAQKNAEAFRGDFEMIRRDMKKLEKKGVESFDLFG